MKKFHLLPLILLLIFTSCYNYRKLSESEIISKDYRSNYNKILEENKNIISVFDNTHSKLFYTDKKGFWNEVKWVDKTYKNFKYKQFPKFQLNEDAMVDVQEEIRAINRTKEYATDTSYVYIEFVHPEIRNPIYYEKGNTKSFKKEKFNSPYLKTLQEILNLN